MDGQPLAISTELSVESRPEVILGHSSGQENLTFRNLPENQSFHEIPVAVELSNRQALAIRMVGAGRCIKADDDGAPLCLCRQGIFKYDSYTKTLQDLCSKCDHPAQLHEDVNPLGNLSAGSSDFPRLKVVTPKCPAGRPVLITVKVPFANCHARLDAATRCCAENS